jgi:hypothetical protein
VSKSRKKEEHKIPQMRYLYLNEGSGLEHARSLRRQKWTILTSEPKGEDWLIVYVLNVKPIKY